MKPNGEGPFLLLIFRGTEGWAISRYANEEALVAGLQGGETLGSPFLVAQELRLVPLPESQVEEMT
jgi:hypothetical protein